MRLRGPAEILAFLPYQLGYHPSESAVVICWSAGRVGLLQRIDLPPREHVADAVASLLPALRAEGPDAVLLVGYERGEGDSRPMLDALGAACERERLLVTDRLVVRDGRWFSLDCDNGACCPADGTPLTPARDVPAVAEMVGVGVSPLPDRAALADRLRSGRPLRARAIGAAADTLLDAALGVMDEPAARVEWREEQLRAWSTVLRVDDEAPPVGGLDHAELARCAVALVDVELRDALIAWVSPGNLPFELIEPPLLRQLDRLVPRAVTTDAEADGQLMARTRLESRLVDLCAQLPAEWAVAPLTVLAAYTWWRGDGALTRTALEAALETDPSYRLARLLLQMVDHGVRPDQTGRRGEPRASA